MYFTYDNNQNLLIIDDDYANLLSVNDDSSVKFQFTYKVSSHESIKNNATKVNVSVFSFPSDLSRRHPLFINYKVSLIIDSSDYNKITIELELIDKSLEHNFVNALIDQNGIFYTSNSKGSCKYIHVELDFDCSNSWVMNYLFNQDQVWDSNKRNTASPHDGGFRFSNTDFDELKQGGSLFVPTNSLIFRKYNRK
jgi:hypothetical protein